MTEISDRWRRIATDFTDRVHAVPDGAWENPAPCEGWTARDVVRHLVEWMPWMFFTSPGLDAPSFPSVDDDPVAAWDTLNASIQDLLDDPETAKREFEMRMMGTFSVENAVDRFGTGDILIHTWDVARATGLDERLDAEEVGRMYGAMSSIDEDMLRNSGQFGPQVDVPDDADEQTKLIAFTGRQP
ncbi:MAG: TIGR03086 family metal-binding protein [Actinomycetota bacterium]